MSVSDPLVKDIKGCVQQFLNMLNCNTPITDNNFHFLLFVQTLEKIFEKGLIRQQNTKYFNRTIDCYAWMISMVKADEKVCYTYRSCVDQVKERHDVYTNGGRLRLLIKYCLLKKCLHVPVETLIRSQYANTFYTQSSILGDEILSEIFLAVLRQVGKLNFTLNLKNSSFLDISWYIPNVIETELVPCKNLGIAVSFTHNKAVIVNVDPDSVAAECGQICVGDVLDELNDIHISSTSKGRLNLIMKLNKLKPIKVKVVKAYDKQIGKMYEPIENLLKDLKTDLLETVRKQYEGNENDNSDKKKSSHYGFPVRYLGSLEVGTQGNVKQIQKALRSFCDMYPKEIEAVKKVNKMVSLEIGEIGIKIWDKETCDIILNHSYMKISSCGNVPALSKMFGYCAGEQNCDIAKIFTCYIFEADSFDDMDTILQSIGQGFHRTHYAV